MSCPWIRFLLLVILAMLVILGYALSARTAAGLGFPLDDAWIHQTYACNLARLGEWSFIPGQPSGGSTAPLWTLALSAGHWIGLPPLGWAYALGALLWILLAASSARWFALRNPPLADRAWMVALFIALEWHLGWSAASGMETLLFSLFVVLSMFAAEAFDPRLIWDAVEKDSGRAKR